MFTSLDKALSAVVMGALSIAVQSGYVEFTPENAERLTVAIAAVTPILVWLIPNRKK